MKREKKLPKVSGKFTDFEACKEGHTECHRALVQKLEINHHYFYFVDTLESSRLLHENLDYKKV